MNSDFYPKTHSEYILQTLLYIVRLVNEGDYSQVISLGLTQEQAKRIGTLSLEGLHELAMSMRSHMFKIAFDPQVLEAAFGIYSRRHQERQEIIDLITAGASYPVIGCLTGLSKNDFSQIRRQLNLSSHDIGRYELPDEATQQLVWSSWLEHSALNDKQRLLAVHQHTGVKVRAIWGLLMDWNETGLTPPITPPTDAKERPATRNNENGNASYLAQKAH